jgi:hypothetical protein
VRQDAPLISGLAMDNIKVYSKWVLPREESLGMVGMHGIKQERPIATMFAQVRIGVLGPVGTFSS